MKRFACSSLVLAFVLLAPGMASAQGPAEGTHWSLKVVDAVFVRPAAMVVSFASTGAFVATLPLTMPTGIADTTAYVLVNAPWRFTSGRPLGRFDEYWDGRTIYGTVGL